MILLGFERTPAQWRFIFSAWTFMSYVWQCFGVIWIVWGLALTAWTFTTQDTSRMSPGLIVILALVLIVPSAIVFFGAWRFRRWTKRQLAALPRSEQRPPLALP